MSKKTANQKTITLIDRAALYGILLSFEQAHTLRRAELTLHRWAELECGDSNEHASYAVERDETSNRPFMVIYSHNGKTRRYPVADREAGALKRVAAVCKKAGIFFFHQTDPRGCALYISKEQLSANDYSRGLACCD